MSIDFLTEVVERPPEGWTLGHVKITMRDSGERKIVEGWERGAFVVHEIERNGKRFGRATHKPSGMEFSTFESLDDAADAIEMVEGLRDWSSMDKATASDRDEIFGALGREFYRENAAEMDFGFLMVWFRKPALISGEGR